MPYFDKIKKSKPIKSKKNTFLEPLLKPKNINNPANNTCRFSLLKKKQYNATKAAFANTNPYVF